MPNLNLNNAKLSNSNGFVSKPIKQENNTATTESTPNNTTHNNTTENSTKMEESSTQQVSSESQVWQKLNYAIDALMRFYNVKAQRGNIEILKKKIDKEFAKYEISITFFNFFIGGNPEGPIVDLLPSGLTKRQVLAQIGLQLGIKAEDMPNLTGNRGNAELSSGAWSNSSSSSPQRTCNSPTKNEKVVMEAEVEEPEMKRRKVEVQDNEEEDENVDVDAEDIKAEQEETSMVSVNYQIFD